VKACADSNTIVVWTGEDGFSFYASSLSPTRSNKNAKAHARTWANRNARTAVARRMFQERFGEMEVTQGRSVQEMRGMEGIRVRSLYAQLGERFGVTWKGRKYDKGNWELADDINRAISVANASLYSMTAAVVVGMGFLPQLGFIHETGDIPFVCDIADIYKHETSFPAAFEVLSQMPASQIVQEQTRSLLKWRVEERRILPRMVRLLSGFFEGKHIGVKA
jgi:CRISPR-associated protein Cas1